MAVKTTEQVLYKLRIKCRSSESRLLVSLRKFRPLVSDAYDVNITPPADLTYSSLDQSVLSAPESPATTPIRAGVKAGRLPSDASTAAVWSGQEDARVSPMSTVPEENSSFDAGRDADRSAPSNFSRRPLKSASRSDQQPFYIYNEFLTLRKRFEDFNDKQSELLNALAEDDPFVEKVTGKTDHYIEVFDLLESAMNDLLWMICQTNDHPLPV